MCACWPPMLIAGMLVVAAGEKQAGINQLLKAAEGSPAASMSSFCASGACSPSGWQALPLTFWQMPLGRVCSHCIPSRRTSSALAACSRPLGRCRPASPTSSGPCLPLPELLCVAASWRAAPASLWREERANAGGGALMGASCAGEVLLAQSEGSWRERGLWRWRSAAAVAWAGSGDLREPAPGAVGADSCPSEACRCQSTAQGHTMVWLAVTWLSSIWPAIMLQLRCLESQPEQFWQACN